MWVTEGKCFNNFQRLSFASRILWFPETVTWHKPWFCHSLLEGLVQILSQASHFCLFFPCKTSWMSQHPVIYSSYAVVFFCLLICCCSRIVSCLSSTSCNLLITFVFLWTSVESHQFFQVFHEILLWHRQSLCSLSSFLFKKTCKVVKVVQPMVQTTIP